MALDGDGLAAGDTTRVVANFFAGDSQLRGGVRLAVGDSDGDGRSDILAGIGPGAASFVRAFRPDGGTVQTVSAFDGTFLGGVFVGGTGGSVRVSEIRGGSAPRQFVDVFGQFLPGVPTRVVFSDGSGYRVEVPASVVTNNRLRVGLPVYTDPTTGDVTDVNFTAAVVQTTPSGEIFSATFNQTLTDIDAVGENPGDLTEEVSEDVRESLLASIFDLEYAAQFLGDEFTDEELLEEAYTELATLDEQLSEFEELPDPGEQYVPPPTVELDPDGFPVYPPFSLPDVSLADYGFGEITTDAGNVDDAAAEILRIYNEAGADAFEFAGDVVEAAATLAGARNAAEAGVIGMAVATAIRTGTNNIINNLPPAQANRLWPQGQPPVGVQSNATAQRPAANPLFGIWTGSKTFGPTQRSFVLTISQNGVSLRITGNRAAEFSTGSGKAPASVIGSTSVSGQAVGSWSSSLGSTRSVGFSGGLTSDGRLDCNIDGIEVFLSK